MKKSTSKDQEKFKKVQEDYYNSIPEAEKNPNHKEDFEKLLELAVKNKPVKKAAKKP